MSETQAAQLTGTGRGAVATICVDGPDAVSIVMRYFQSASNVSQLKIDKIYFGQWRWQEYREDLVITRTAENRVEIHCHGGRLAAKTILESLSEGGAQVVDGRTWILNSPDLFAGEALALLPEAKTQKTAAILLDQSRGALLSTLAEVSDQLLSSSSHVASASALLHEVLEFESLGKRITSGFQVLLLGVPNSGKSSLVNALVGFERAIVYDQPGTTRDVVTAETALDGWPVTLFDTAGMRETADRVESIGMEKAQQQATQADLILQIHDLSRPDDLVDSSFFDFHHVPVLRVGTKLDLTADSAGRAASRRVDVATSSVANCGLEELCERICNSLVPRLPKPGQAVPISERQIDCVRDLLSKIEDGEVEEAINAINAISADMLGD